MFYTIRLFLLNRIINSTFTEITQLRIKQFIDDESILKVMKFELQIPGQF